MILITAVYKNNTPKPALSEYLHSPLILLYLILVHFGIN